MWKPIETAPKGSGLDGPDRVDHPDYIKPPKLLLLYGNEMSVGYYDWYYHEGYGRGYDGKTSAWVADNENFTCTDPDMWMPLPEPPAAPAHHEPN